MGEKKRYTIGVLIGGVHTYFPKEHMRGIIDAARKLDVNVCFFLGTQTRSFFEDILGEEQSSFYDYQFSTIHEYSIIGGLDGLIVNFGTLGMYLKDTDADDFARKFSHIPMVFLMDIVHTPNCHYLISDNYQGICQVMEHLICDHHCRRILFVTGPNRNTDAAERKRAYFDMMKQYGLPVRPDMVAKGDYSEYVDRQVEQLLDCNPDAQAIVFSNDEMVLAGYRVCKKRGLTVGKDILITGYDDCEMASGLTPSLTTVQQDGFQMGQMAVRDILDRIEGKDVQSRRLPVTLMRRGSCGCWKEEAGGEEKTSLSLEEEVQRLNQTITEMKFELVNFQRRSWYIPILARELNDCAEDEKLFCAAIMKKMKELHTASSYLFLLDEPIAYDGEGEWICPEYLRLAAYTDGVGVVSYQREERPYVTKEHGICHLMEDGRVHQFMVFLLFSQEMQYGLLACDIEEEDFPFFYVISLQIGLSLRYLEISKNEAERRREMSKNMERIREKNRMLGIMSEYDELTGLLNLRGFRDQARKFCEEASREQSAYMIYGDLDHLKEINDNWGHQEGNEALKTAVHILKSCLRSNDILARIGGDEFVAIVSVGQEGFEEVFQERIRHVCEEENQNLQKPYYVEISVGIVRFFPKTVLDIQNVVSDADQRLYEAKKTRRRSVRKDRMPDK